MTIRRSKKPHDPYTRISNTVAQDLTISYGAIRVWLYLVTKPEDWDVLPKHLALKMGMGKDKMYSILNELIKKGLCRREQKRVVHSSGRQVLGSMEYVIYDDPQDPPSFECFQCPGFQDTENQCTENQYTENPETQKPDLLSKNKESTFSTTNKRYIQITEDKLLIPEIEKKPPPPLKNSVVVPSYLSNIEDLPKNLAEKLLIMFTEEQLLEAVEKLRMSSVPITKPFGWIRDCIQVGYELTKSSEQKKKENIKILKDCFGQLDGKTIGGRKIEVYPDKIEFFSGGAANVTHFIHCNEPGFETKVREYVKELQQIG